ncbi:YLP motif-containing protein 1 isoform X2 [Megalops cyprinoides]|uniref:YLP motif-containing protein 1 isoform X2 n=1 Tax=Megalops cyprinoides TaxID=118141 RepID=UPI001863B00E|nr:YLP motif-containing protein 1 isoform X2 [Megalops cyprinoides]
MYPSWGNYGGGHQPPPQPHFGVRPPHLRGPPPAGGGFGGYGAPAPAPTQSNFSSLREQHLQQMQQLQQLHQKQLQSVLHHNTGPYGGAPPGPWQGSGSGFSSLGPGAPSPSNFQDHQPPRGPSVPPPLQQPPPQPVQQPQSDAQRPPPEPTPPVPPQNSSSIAPHQANKHDAAVKKDTPEPSKAEEEEKPDFSSMTLQEQQQYWYKQHLQNLQRLKNEKAKHNKPQGDSQPPPASQIPAAPPPPAEPPKNTPPPPPPKEEPPPPPPPEDSKPSIITPPGDPAEAARLQQLQAAAAQWQQTQQQRAGFQYQALMQQHAQLQQVLQQYQQFIQQPAHLQTMPVEMQLRHYEMQQQQFGPVYQEWDRQFKLWQEQFQSYPHKDELQDYESQWKQWQEQMKSTSVHLQERVTTLRAMQHQYTGAPYGGMMGMGQFGQYRPPVPEAPMPSSLAVPPAIPPPSKLEPTPPPVPPPQSPRPTMPQGPAVPPPRMPPPPTTEPHPPPSTAPVPATPAAPAPPDPFPAAGPPVRGPRPPGPQSRFEGPRGPRFEGPRGNGFPRFEPPPRFNVPPRFELRQRFDQPPRGNQPAQFGAPGRFDAPARPSGPSRFERPPGPHLPPRFGLPPKADPTTENKPLAAKADAPSDPQSQGKPSETPKMQAVAKADEKDLDSCGAMSDDILDSGDGFFIQSEPIPQTTVKPETQKKPEDLDKESGNKSKPAADAVGAKVPVSAEHPVPPNQTPINGNKGPINQGGGPANSAIGGGVPQRPQPPGPPPPKTGAPEPPSGFHQKDHPMGPLPMGPLPMGPPPMGPPAMARGRGRGLPLPPPGRGQGRGQPGGPVGPPCGFSPSSGSRAQDMDQMEYDYRPQHGEEEGYEWQDPALDGMHGRRPPPPHEEMWGGEEEEDEHYQEEYYEEPGRGGPPLGREPPEGPGRERHWKEQEPEYWEEGDPYWMERRPPMRHGPPFPHEESRRPPPPHGLRHHGPRRPPFPHEDMEHDPWGPPPPPRHDMMERDPMGPPPRRDHGPPRPPLHPDMLERDMRRPPPSTRDALERDLRGPPPYHREPMERDPGWPCPPHDRDRRPPMPHEILERDSRRGPPMGHDGMERDLRRPPPPHDGPDRGMEHGMYDRGYRGEFRPEGDEYRRPPHDYHSQDYEREEDFYPPQGEWEGERRDREYPPYPPRGPPERFREDQWAGERERPYPYEGEARERGELRAREYPEESAYRRDEPAYPPLPPPEWERPLPERSFPPEERRPLYEACPEPPVELPPPTVPAPPPNPSETPLDQASPGAGKGILALSQRQHEIILKAAQELKMIRELQENKNVMGDFLKPETVEVQPEIPPGLLGLEIPPEVRSALQATNLRADPGQAPPVSVGTWEAGPVPPVTDPGYMMAQPPAMDGKPLAAPIVPKPPIIPKTVDYGHGHDGGSTVERISYGERIVLRPDPLPSERPYEKEPLGPRDPYDRDPYYDRRLDPYMDRRDYSRERDRDLYQDKPPLDYDRERYERERYLRDDRLPPGPPPRPVGYREREMRDSRERDREGRSSRDRDEHYGRPMYDRPPYDRVPERPIYDHGPSAYPGDRRPFPEERLPVPAPPKPPPPPAPPRVEKKPETKNVDDILKPPGRESRPERIVIIMRGLPGSGKSHVAKLIRDKEVECGGAPPRVLGLDDYFMAEVEKVEKDPDTGKRVKSKVMEYEYEPEMEETYRNSMLKTFRKTLDDGFFPFIIIDAINDRVKYFDQFWSAAKTKGFEVYLAEITADNQTCAKRNVHGRKLKDIVKMAANWEPSPRHMVRLDIRSLLQDAAIEEVEMEDFNPSEEEQKAETKEAAAEEEEADLTS